MDKDKLKKSVPLQGEVWLFDPDPVRGNELGKKVRPALIISNNLLNKGPSGLLIIVPISSKAKGIASHIAIVPPEGGLKQKSYAMCEQLRSVSRERFVKKCGVIHSRVVLEEILSWIGDLLWLD